MIRPAVKETSSRTCRSKSHPAPSMAGVMNLVQMSLPLSCFLAWPEVDGGQAPGTLRVVRYRRYLQGETVENPDPAAVVAAFRSGLISV
ncbi:hypothetical protein P0N66_03755 [Desulfurivibrio alkaliphilus]|nr:hypothetical protein [Desulfurivibrio alkaliphilus]MDF1614061.1 hypothetical protein [Desulfurivibrio alkaliphilus]